MSALVSARDLIPRHRGAARRARATFIERYLPLARSLARRYGNSGEPLDHLVQVASLGLLKAADRWDPEHGAAFSSFAVPTILGELRRYFRDLTWCVRPPRGLQELCLSVERMHERVYAKHGREPSIVELAEALGQPPALVTEALRAREWRAPRSLEAAPPGGAGRLTLPDQPGSGEPGFAPTEARLTVEMLLGRLDHRAREILH